LHLARFGDDALKLKCASRQVAQQPVLIHELLPLQRTMNGEQGFGIQAEINISGALREKLGVELPPQIILGACNPQLAYKALQAEPGISLLLPCNVTVRQNGAQVEVAVI
jgi:uncharacterized protein (DUF302 family)